MIDPELDKLYENLNKLYVKYFRKYKEYIIHTDPIYTKIFKYEIEKTYNEIEIVKNKIEQSNKSDSDNSDTDNIDTKTFKSFILKK